MGSNSIQIMESKFPVKTVPSLNFRKNFLLSGAFLPFRILQFSGFFPLSLKNSSNTVSVSQLAWHLCPSTIWIIFLIVASVFPTAISTLLGNNDVNNAAKVEFSNKGHNTIVLTSQVWGFCCLFCPLFSRVDLLIKRAEFVSFWNNYVQLVEKFQNLDINFENASQKHIRNSRIVIFLHLIIHLAPSCLQIGLFVGYVLFMGGSHNRINFVDSIPNWVYSFNIIFAGFSLHGLIYFVSSYNFGIHKLLKCLENERIKVHDVIGVYISLDKSVTKFTALFSTFLNVNVIYVFVYLLYAFYFVYVAIKMDTFILGGVTIVQTGITVWYFYLLSNSASGLVKGSQMFCKMMKYSRFKEEIRRGQFVKFTERFEVLRLIFRLL